MSPPLDSIGDIANPTLSETVGGSVTWETASDWDSAVSQDPNVIHEAIGDITDAAVVRLGYSASDFGGNTDKTTTLHSDDASGPLTNPSGSSDFTEQGSPLYEQTGVWGTQAVDTDGTNDFWYADSASFSEGAGQFTMFAWVNLDSTSGIQRLISHQGGVTGNDVVLTLRVNGGNAEVLARDDANGSLAQATGSTSLLTGDWYALAGRVDAANNQVFVYVDGTQDGSGSGTLSQNAGDWDTADDKFSYMGFYDGDNTAPKEPVDGTGDWGQIWTRDVGATAVADLSSLTGELTTATKSLAGSSQPDLESLDYTLNGENLEIEVIGSPGTGSEEVVTSGNLDGTQTTATLSWSSSHQDFRIRPILKTTKAPTSTPTLNSATLTA